MARRPKRMLVISDLHCGHLAGLTPPRYQFKPKQDTLSPTKRGKFCEIQSQSWNWYLRNIRKAGPFDVVVVNGDAIDGAGKRSGGTEVITTDRAEQCDMAIRCIQPALQCKGKTKLVMTYGTGYHTGNEEDWEGSIADALGGKIGSHEWIDLNGTVFDFKHHTGSSTIPHGRHTPTAKEVLWNKLWSAEDWVDEADVIVRSHVHYYQGGFDRSKLHLTTPALQGMGSKYGARRCSGLVDFGFLVFESDRKGEITWPQAHLAKAKSLPAQKTTVTVI